MVKVLIGLCWIFFGLIFFLRPWISRSWLRWRSLRKIRWTLFWFALGGGISLVVAAWSLPGGLAKIVIALGLLGIAKGYYFLKCESSEWLIEHFAELPEGAFRWYAMVYVVIGFLLIFVL